MSQWHADLNAYVMEPGTVVTVLSHHQVVRVITADTLLIQNRDGDRFTALVRGRSGGTIQLVLDDGRAISLELVEDESLQPPGTMSDVFSHQKWVTH